MHRGPIYNFTTKEIPEGIEVQLIKVHSDKFLQSSTKIPVLNGKDVATKRICPNPQCGHEFVPGEWMKEIYVDSETGEDVSMRRPEFQWFKEDAEGKRTPASMLRNENINATVEKPFMLLEKNLVRKKDGEFNLMVPWLGEKKKPSGRPEAVALRTKKLVEEAQRMAREGVAGIGSFTTGQAFGKPTDPYPIVIYPYIIDDKRAMWFVVPCAGVIHPEREDFPYPEAILEMPEQEIPTSVPRAKAQAETIAVENFL